MKMLLTSAFAAAAFLSAAPAAAAVIQGDFRTESDLPSMGAGAKVYQNLGATLGAGFELDADNFVSNPSDWGGGVVFADWDASTNILTLSSQDMWDFQTFNFTVSNILFNSAQAIGGITLIDGALTDIGLVPTFGFTNNSLSISYTAHSDVFNFTGNSARFQVALTDLAGGVPEPTTWAMLIIGFGAVGVAARRSRSHAATMAA